MINNINIGENAVVYGSISQGNGISEVSRKLKRMKQNSQKYDDVKYDVAISYASEQEQYVRRVYKILKEEGLQVFFAPEEEGEYIAKDLLVSFYKIFRYKSKYNVCFISKEYRDKDYTMQEYQAALVKHISEKRNCLIIVNFNDTEMLPYCDKDMHYICAGERDEIIVANKILQIIKK